MSLLEGTNLNIILGAAYCVGLLCDTILLREAQILSLHLKSFCKYEFPTKAVGDLARYK
jgi:hypothetical protein